MIGNILNANCLEWVKYSEYEYVADKKGGLYLEPTEDSIIKMYNPIPVIAYMMTEALNIGYASKLHLLDESNLQDKVLNFVRNYGLLGIINTFICGGDYSADDNVSFKKFEYFNKETMKIKDYIKLFSTFGNFNNAEKDKNVLSTTTMTERPLSYIFIFSKEYSEKYDWILSVFENMADIFNISQQNRRAEFEFKDVSFSLKTGTTTKLVWNISSLPQAMELALGVYLTDSKTLLRSCRHCHQIFFTQNPRAQFCSPRCKNQYNVYKSREIHGR